MILSALIVCGCIIGVATVVMVVLGSIQDRLTKEIEQLNSEVLRLQDAVDRVLEEQENGPN